jgi:hypothetical protein
METPYAPAPVNEATKSAVSWPAILAGAAATVSSTLILIVLGSGLGLASASAWPNSGASAAKLGAAAAIWLIVVQWISAGLGGYLAGRLRTRWVATHTHEVFFRDTANGFVTWAVAAFVLVAALSSGASAVLGAGVHSIARIGAGVAQGAPEKSGTTLGAYDVDTLFRSTQAESSTPSGDGHAEATRILAKGLTAGDVPPADRAYLAALVSARAGVPQDDAQRRVDDVITQVKAADLKAREAADSARKAAATVATLTALSMLVGAFIACAAAALGGHERDLHP